MRLRDHLPARIAGLRRAVAAFAVVVAGTVRTAQAATPFFLSSFDEHGNEWTVVRGAAAPDAAVLHGDKKSLRLEAARSPLQTLVCGRCRWRSPSGVWYFGENTMELIGGRPSTLAGSFSAGVDGAKPGIVMEGHPAIGDFYRQEFALGEAEDFAEVTGLSATVTVPAGRYTHCLRTRETTPLEPDLEGGQVVLRRESAMSSPRTSALERPARSSESSTGKRALCRLRRSGISVPDSSRERLIRR